MAKAWIAAKDPDEVKDYEVDWSDLLGTDVISTSAWSVAVGAGLTINSNSKTSTTTTVWLSAGTIGVDYELLNRVVTTGGRTYDQTCLLKMRAK